MGWRLSFSSLQSDWPWAPFSILSNWLLWVLSTSVMWLHRWAGLSAVVFFVKCQDQNARTHVFMAWHWTKDRETLSMRNTFLGLQFDPIWVGFSRNVTQHHCILLYLLMWLSLLHNSKLKYFLPDMLNSCMVVECSNVSYKFVVFLLQH